LGLALSLVRALIRTMKLDSVSTPAIPSGQALAIPSVQGRRPDLQQHHPPQLRLPGRRQLRRVLPPRARAPPDHKACLAQDWLVAGCAAPVQRQGGGAVPERHADERRRAGTGDSRSRIQSSAQAARPG
jgi:hypothetical protein